MLDWIVVVPLVAVAALCLSRFRWLWLEHGRRDLDWLPTELHGAELVWSEKTFRSKHAVPIVARIDRAYRSTSGELVLIEFKRRGQRRVHPSDLVELSAQRYVLQQASHVVSGRAYVVVILPDGMRCRALPVDLEDERQVESRAARLMTLVERRASPRGAVHPAICGSCGHRNACPRGARQFTGEHS